jgi:hypothetical protein
MADLRISQRDAQAILNFLARHQAETLHLIDAIASAPLADPPAPPAPPMGGSMPVDTQAVAAAQRAALGNG